MLVPKDYKYIHGILLKVFQTRITSEGNVDNRIVLSSDDPRRITPNIAAIPPPSVKSRVEEHKSRF